MSGVWTWISAVLKELKRDGPIKISIRDATTS